MNDIVQVCTALAGGGISLAAQRVFNMGGPERVSRVDMAEAVAAVRGHDPGSIQSVSSATVDRGCASPPDISMDSARLEGEMRMKMTPFKDALKEIFAGSCAC